MRLCFPSPGLRIAGCLALGLIASDAVAQSGRATVRASGAATAVDDFRRISSRYKYDDLSDTDAWQDVSLEYAQRSGYGTWIAGVNAARRNALSGTQLELQAYPRLSRHSYVFLDVATSSSEGVYLPFRAAAEPYYNFANGWEVSAGAHYLRPVGRDVVTYTGALAKYFGNYWISARPFFTRAENDNSYSGGVTGRRFFSGRYDYAELKVSRSVGVDPEAIDPSMFNRQPKLGSFAATLERRQPLGHSHARATYGFGYEKEQTAPGRTRTHRSATLGLEWFVP